jgi:hypothetical protein
VAGNEGSFDLQGSARTVRPSPAFGERVWQPGCLRTPEARTASSDLVEGDHLNHEVDMGEVRIPVAHDHRMQATS